MRILEARDGFIKFETPEKIALSSFVEVNDKRKIYIAQIIQTQKLNELIIAFAKILFIYDGTFNCYDGTNPTKDATIKSFPFDLINRSFKTETPVNIGNFISTTEPVEIDLNTFSRKMLISIDSPKKTNLLTTNLAKNINKDRNIIVIDMAGTMDSSAKFKAGNDFKLPLNTEALNFLYEDCLNDATSDSKNLVKEIFQDLADYSKTVPFLPFKTLKTIIDDMVDKSHIFKLLVLKNKLSKFDRENLFAEEEKEVKSLKKVLTSKTAVIDISKLDNLFQNRYLKHIYNALSEQNYDGLVVVLLSNAITKNNIKNFLTSPILSSTFITTSRFKYLKDFKSLFTNYVIEPTFANNEIFKTYSTFLNNMSKDSLLLVGDSTNFIPVIFNQNASDENSPFDDVINIDEESDNAVNTIIIEEDPKDEQTEAIEKKSEDLIAKLTETDSINESENKIELFGEDEEELENNSVSEDLTELEPENQEEALKENITNENEIIEELEDSELISQEQYSEENIEDSTEIAIEDNILTESFSEDTEYHTNIDPIQTIEVSEEITDMTENDVADLTTELLIEDTKDSTENIENYDIDKTNELIEESVEEYIETEIIQVENSDDELEDIIELDESDLDDDTIVVEMEGPEELALNQEIIEDVDKVFTTMKDDTLSDSDLDFIDELNEESDTSQNVEIESDNELEEIVASEDLEELNDYPLEEQEDSFLEPLEEVNSLDTPIEESEEKDVLETKNSTTPIVPVYSAEIPPEDIVASDPIEQGDTVIHAKYGNGIVEKMIKYGTKTLYSINFDNVGRRLLDPTLTEIKKS